MKTSFKMIAGVVAALAILPNRASAANAMPALYTAAQAHDGAIVYQQYCEACHGTSLEGVAAPALKGQAFGEMATAQGLTVVSLITVVSNTMPQSDPGSLTATQVNAVVAYPAGATALTPDTAAHSHVKLAVGENKEVAATKADIREDKAEAAKKTGAMEDKTNAKVKLRPHKTKHAM
jgi:mono/diheme cytochrome c family protein